MIFIVYKYLSVCVCPRHKETAAQKYQALDDRLK